MTSSIDMTTFPEKSPFARAFWGRLIREAREPAPDYDSMRQAIGKLIEVEPRGTWQ